MSSAVCLVAAGVTGRQAACLLHCLVGACVPGQLHGLLQVPTGPSIFALSASMHWQGELTTRLLMLMLIPNFSAPRRVQALVMSPTRELATQTEKNIMALGEFMKVRAHCCIGGKSIGESHPDSPFFLKLYPCALACPHVSGKSRRRSASPAPAAGFPIRSEVSSVGSCVSRASSSEQWQQ